MAHVIHPTWKNEVVQGSLSPFQPSQQTLARFCHDFELDRAASLLLDNGGAVADAAAANQISDTQLHKVATAQLAVDRKVEQGAITQAPMFVEIEPDGPDIAWSERALRPYILSSVPRAPFMHGGVKI